MRIWAVVCLCLSATLVGCSDNPSYRELIDETRTETDAAQPSTLIDGGGLTLAMFDFPTTLNPLRADAPSIALKVAPATYPRMFKVVGDGTLNLDTDFFSSVRVVRDDPQTISIAINPEAVWSDGSPISWHDVRCQADVLASKIPALRPDPVPGFDRIESVTRGCQRLRTVLTFKRGQPYAEWKGMFAAPYVLLPCSTNTRADVFMSKPRAGALSGGPFVVVSVDEQARKITLKRNPRWWGATPRLESLDFQAIGWRHQIHAFQEDHIKAIEIRSDNDLVSLENYAQKVDIRSSSQRGWVSIVFNTLPDKPTVDRELRRAIVMSIDRHAVASFAFRGLTRAPATQDNQVVVQDSDIPARVKEELSHHSRGLAFNPSEAAGVFDALGWHLKDGVRTRDGHPPVLKMLDFYSVDSVNDALTQQLSDVGVGLQIVDAYRLDSAEYGNFDAPS